MWGILELTLGGYLHFIHFPQKGYVMGAIAYAILGRYIVKHRIVYSPILIGLIAASFKLFNIVIYQVPILSRSIINPALAIIAEAASVSMVAFIVTKFWRFKTINEEI